MFKIFLTIIRFFFLLVSSNTRNNFIENAILKKENEILKRKQKKKLKLKLFDRLLYARGVDKVHPVLKICFGSYFSLLFSVV